jgi:clan AA aspartic protease (TIGR02281 family)
MARSHKLLGIGLVLALLLFGAQAGAEIYRWTDSSGRMHFTQDLNQVPPEHRVAAEEGSKTPSTARIQTYKSSPASPSVTRRTSAARSGGGKTYRIRVQRAGNSMAVNVLINGRVKVPFHIDTGATDVVLPKWAADELGLDLSKARTGVYGTANGTVTQKLVRLSSVDMGGAVVQDVPATISPSMRHGLLGLSYFNHFKYNFDPVAGVVTLRENDLAESGVLKGGRSRQQWTQQFAAIKYRIEDMEKRRDGTPFSRTRKRAELDGEVERLEHELELLDGEADDARVPFSWRD